MSDRALRLWLIGVAVFMALFVAGAIWLATRWMDHELARAGVAAVPSAQPPAVAVPGSDGCEAPRSPGG